MVSPNTSDRPSYGMLRMLVPLLGSEILEIIPFFLRLARQTLKYKAREGIYEVLDYHAQLELLDTNGKHAVLHKRQKVRFMQDNVIAFQDKAWGDGKFLAHYKSSPGVAVDMYREGHRYNILISLRETKHAGDVEEFRIDRTIREGFTKSTEDFQIEIDHRTRHFTIAVVFPGKRLPKEVILIEQNSTRRQVLGSECQVDLPNGCREVRWYAKKPRLFEAYILRWTW